MQKRAIAFIKQEIVFILSFLLAVVSCFFVTPSKEYIDYIDFRVLALLFCLMIVIQGFASIGVFHKLGETLLKKLSTTRALTLVLICLCFFSSMLITNDVALITFVPFTVLILQLANKMDRLITIVVLETIASNLGSMLTPLGNPQNLYLYTVSGMSLGSFILTLLPYSAVAFLLLVICTLFIRKESISIQMADEHASAKEQTKGILPTKGLLILYSILFVLCLLVVLHVLPFPVVLILVSIAALIFDRAVFRQVDYFLLLTFLCFFIFIGNMKNIPAVHEFLSRVITDHEFLSGLLASQVISNVPATLLLSGFTDKWPALLIGVNIGGLGTLIASLASLISYKLYVKTADSKTSRYLLTFTLYSIVFLAILVPLYFLLN
ncbi:MAG: citrate transporter [Lachnospiraceae bacterium]|nr:citrate transporter [Lachnospiraceae bacterium]MBP3507310.1 citrate transporter [Lachnospiraceae bacterium]